MSDWIEPGQRAPAFTLTADDGSKVRLSDLKGRPVVLYFYPKDDTPGCTREACAFRDRQAPLKKLGAVVLGVSTDSIESHGKFRDKYRLNFPLLADEDHAVAEKYGAWREKNMYGKKSMGIQRSTFLIDAAGKVAKVWKKVKVDGHDEQVLEALRRSGVTPARSRCAGRAICGCEVGEIKEPRRHGELGTKADGLLSPVSRLFFSSTLLWHPPRPGCITHGTSTSAPGMLLAAHARVGCRRFSPPWALVARGVSEARRWIAIKCFMILTRGPFPTGEAWDEEVEAHLETCAECWRLAEALRPALEVFQEAVPPAEGRDLPGYWGDARPASTVVAELTAPRRARPWRPASGIFPVLTAATQGMPLYEGVSANLLRAVALISTITAAVAGLILLWRNVNSIARAILSGMCRITRPGQMGRLFSSRHPLQTFSTCADCATTRCELFPIEADFNLLPALA